MNEPDSDNSLEDEDLRFKGYCYTTSGFDKTKVCHNYNFTLKMIKFRVYLTYHLLASTVHPFLTVALDLPITQSFMVQSKI